MKLMWICQVRWFQTKVGTVSFLYYPSGEELNFGLNNKFTTVEECINFCETEYRNEAKYFVWSDERLGDPGYENACWCKSTKYDINMTQN